MTSTPPAQIRAEARTPPTPLHGSAYYSNSPSRYNTRSAAKRSSDSAHSSFTQSPRSARTPRSPQHSDLHFHSPHATPKRKSARHTRMMSPASQGSDTNEPIMMTQQKPTYLSATTVLSEGMLPTPVKTPQKKQMSKSNMAARALFQDQTTAPFESPRKSQKKKVRHNGFSLESFSEDPTAQNPIQIHVDSRDQVPEVDVSEDNPFYMPSTVESKKRAAPSTQKISGTSKRRRVAPAKKTLDPQVEEAIEKDEGMVYVFRGKKVYRRFDDAGDEEEVIDPEELGLLQNREDAAEIIKPLKTLTRKSIKPKRLFQPETIEPQPPQSDEEADTEIEDNHNQPEQEADQQDEQPSPSRATRSRPAKDISTNGAGTKRKRSSPFDTWKRLKSSSISTGSVPVSKGRKRTAAEALEE